MKNPEQATAHVQYQLPPTAFDAFNKEVGLQEALGSKRSKQRQESADLRSSNWVPGVSGWRLTPTGLELGKSSGVFPPGTITFTDIQNISTDKVLGRDTAGSGEIEQLGLGAGLSISGGNLVNTITQYTDELAEDAVGGILTDTNSIDFTYNDGANTITADVKTTFITSGTYAPTRSAEANLDSNVTFASVKYCRVGSIVTVSGRFTADPTTTVTATSFELTLPIASNIGAAGDVSGTAFCGTIAAQGAEIIGVAVNDTAKVQWIAGDITSQTWSFIFTYSVI